MHVYLYRLRRCALASRVASQKMLQTSIISLTTAGHPSITRAQAGEQRWSYSTPPPELQVSEGHRGEHLII